MGWHEPIIQFQKGKAMNFRPLPPSVQDAFDAAIVDLLDDSTIFVQADRNCIEKLEAAMALCGPHFDFPGLHGDGLEQMQWLFAHSAEAAAYVGIIWPGAPEFVSVNGAVLIP